MMCQQIIKDPTYKKTVELPVLASAGQAEVQPVCHCTHTRYLSLPILDMPVLEAHIFILLGID